MYICPRCDKQYPQAPEQCVQCKRPLILNKRFRIECSIQSGPAGEDFDVVDLETNEPAILRELRVRKADAGGPSPELDRYEENRERLSKTKFEGNKVLLDAFEAEYTNSRCYYFAFDADAWASLGDELYLGSGASDAGGDDDLPEIEGRDIDPELASLLAGLEERTSGDDDSKKKSKAKDEGGALVKTKDSPPAKKDASSGAIATKAKAAIAISLLVIIAAVVAMLLL